MGVTMFAANLVRAYWQTYVKAQDYATQMLSKWEGVWDREPTPPVLRGMCGRTGPRIGYVVATCSPVTWGHLALARQAADDMDLDAVYFLPWPFFYIPGFHRQPLDGWVAQKQHLPWETRYQLLALALADLKDSRIQVLAESKAWYEQSTNNFAESIPASAFWSGTWYVIRKLQWHARRISDNPEFVFVCGVDQFNPNVESLFSAGAEQVWKDYHIAQHLAVHDVYVVQRSADGFDEVEHFTAPIGSEHEVVVGEPLAQSSFSATDVRLGRLKAGSTLEEYVTPSVAAAIRSNGWWGWELVD